MKENNVSRTEPRDDEMISIVSRKGEVPYGKVKGAVVQLSGAYYFKDDEEHVARVQIAKDKWRLFRKKSKLIVETSPGKWSLRKNVVTTPDGLKLDTLSEDVVQVDGNYVRRDYTVRLGNKDYLRSDKRLVRCVQSDEMVLKEDAIEMASKYIKGQGYGPFFVAKKHALPHIVTQNANGDNIFVNQSIRVLNKEGQVEWVHQYDIGSTRRLNAFYKFKDATNPQMERIDAIPFFEKDIDQFTQLPDRLPNLYIHRSHVEGFNKIYDEVIMLRMAEETLAIKKALRYSDDGADENIAKTVKKIAAPFAGKHPIFTPRDRTPIISKTCKLLGGMNYTFGVELETAQGMLPNKYADATKTSIVGDRSIGAGEYVTPVLHGDDGIKTIKELCARLQDHCFVDDKCGVHVHVGGMNATKGVAEGDFDRQFAIYAIRLGCMIEKDLYKSCPPSRAPQMKHCHSIMRYKDISKDNWREYLGAYVFGPEENWERPFSMKGYSYGNPGQNRAKKTDTWCGGRYKWLNLVHILSHSSFNTCEIRLWAGTLNFEKVYMYILASMAFVWFVENRRGDIERGGVTLDQVLMAPFEAHKSQALGRKLVNFFSNRTDRFKRTVNYPKRVPDAIF